MQLGQCCLNHLRFATAPPPRHDDRRAERTTSRVPKTVWDQILELYPWMKDDRKKTYRHAETRRERKPKRKRDEDDPGSSPSSDSDSSDKPSEHAEPEPELRELIPDLDGLAERLADHREEYKWDDEDVPNFYVFQPGGSLLKTARPRRRQRNSETPWRDTESLVRGLLRQAAAIFLQRLRSSWRELAGTGVVPPCTAFLHMFRSRRR